MGVENVCSKCVCRRNRKEPEQEEKEYPEKNDKNQVEEDSTEIENNQDEGILEDFSQQEEQTVIVEENRDDENQQLLENEPVEMELQEPVLTYKTHVSSIGWQKSVTNGEVAGTTGRALSVEALQMDLEMPDNIEGGIEYAAHVSDIGWQKSVTNGEVAGTTGKAKFIEALKINLTGEIAATYDIYYRVPFIRYWLVRLGKKVENMQEVRDMQRL